MDVVHDVGSGAVYVKPFQIMSIINSMSPLNPVLFDSLS